MFKTPRKQQFTYLCSAACVLFLLLLVASYQLHVYEVFPAYGFIGYSLVIFTILVALKSALLPWHFIAVSVLLILFGTTASFDIVLSKAEMVKNLQHSEFVVIQKLLSSQKVLDDYVDVLLILLNVFTSALAGNSLFYGLNRRNFDNRK